MSSVNSKQQQQPQPSTPQQSQQVIEVQIPISLVKSRSSNRAHINFDGMWYILNSLATSLEN